MVGASNVVQYTVVIWDGRAFRVRKGVTEEIDPQTGIVIRNHETDDLFFGLQLDGPSFGVVTEFLYKVYETPGKGKYDLNKYDNIFST